VLVDQVQALFPKVDGEVIEVQNGTVTLGLGSRDRSFRRRRARRIPARAELRHPKSGEVLGRTEQQVGRLAVQQVFEALLDRCAEPRQRGSAG